MKYILLMHGLPGMKEWEGFNWPPEDVQAHFAHFKKLNQSLLASGELVAVEGLAAPSEARVVRTGKDGIPAITDGPFPESKEFLAGYWMIEVESAERAYEIAGLASAVPGPGREPMALPIEVRRVMCDLAQDL